MTSITSKTTTTLNDLVEALDEGITFYDHAARETDHRGHQDVFHKMSRLKGNIAADLREVVAAEGGKPANDSHWIGEFRKGYTDLKAKLSKDPDATYVAALEAQEDRVVHAFRDAMDPKQPVRVRELAAKYLPDIRQMHDQMRDLEKPRMS